MRNLLRERPWLSTILSLLFVVVPGALTIWREFSTEPLLPRLFAMMGVPPPVVGHVLALVMLTGVGLLGYIVVAVTVPALKARQGASSGLRSRPRGRRSGSVRIPPMTVPPTPSSSVAGTKARPGPTMSALYHAHFIDLLERSKTMMDRVFDSLPSPRQQGAQGLRGQVAKFVTHEGLLKNAGSRFESLLGERGEMDQKVQAHFGILYTRYRRCVLWIVLVADLLGYELEGSDPFRVLVERDKRLREGMATLVASDGYEHLRDAVRGWTLHGHDDVRLRELAAGDDT